MRRHNHFNSDSDDDDQKGPRLLSAYHTTRGGQDKPSPTVCSQAPAASVPPTATVPSSQDADIVPRSMVEALEPLSALLKDALRGVDAHVQEAFHAAARGNHPEAPHAEATHSGEEGDDVEALTEEEFDEHLATLERDMSNEYEALQRVVEQRIHFLQAQREAWNMQRCSLSQEDMSASAEQARCKDIERELEAVRAECTVLKTAVGEQRQFMERVNSRNQAEEDYVIQEINHLRYRMQKNATRAGRSTGDAQAAARADDDV
jgi:hypothetical protein